MDIWARFASFVVGVLVMMPIVIVIIYKMFEEYIESLKKQIEIQKEIIRLLKGELEES